MPTQSQLPGVGPPRPWPADRVERWPIERLIPYANNARLHSEADLDKLSADEITSLEEPYVPHAVVGFV